MVTANNRLTQFYPLNPKIRVITIKCRTPPNPESSGPWGKTFPPSPAKGHTHTLLKGTLQAPITKSSVLMPFPPELGSLGQTRPLRCMGAEWPPCPHHSLQLPGAGRSAECWQPG